MASADASDTAAGAVPAAPEPITAPHPTPLEEMETVKAALQKAVAGNLNHWEARSALAVAMMLVRDARVALAAAPKAAPAVTTAPCKGLNCGCTDGVSHSPECHAEHAAAVAGGTFIPKAAPTVAPAEPLSLRAAAEAAIAAYNDTSGRPDVLQRQMKRLAAELDKPAPTVAPAEPFRPMASAPLDGKPVLLMIEGGEHPLTDDTVSVTIGSYGVEGGPKADPTWHFVGWSWHQDCYCRGDGVPTGWLPVPPTVLASDLPAPTVAQPLTTFTPAQRRRLWDNSPEHHKDAASIAGFERIVTLTERAHGIITKKKGGAHD